MVVQHRLEPAEDYRREMEPAKHGSRVSSTTTEPMDTQPTPMPSAGTLQTLDRHIERALRQRFGSGGNLRHVVRLVVVEMTARGASDEAIRALLRHSVQEHPQRHGWDRVSIVTGLAASVILMRRMLHWADQPNARAKRTSGGESPADRNPTSATT